MSDPTRKRPFLVNFGIETRLVSAASHVQQVRHHLRGLPTTQVPLSIRTRPCGRKSRLKVILPFVQQDQTELPADARCVLRVWELDLWRRGGHDEGLTDPESRKNELLGEIEGFVKQVGKRGHRKLFAFLTDQVPAEPPEQDEQKRGRIAIRLGHLLPEGGFDTDGINWEINVSGEVESRLEIGATIHPKSEAANFTDRRFPYPVVFLHKISEPPTEEEILHVWVEKWKLWKKRKDNHPDWKLDCGVATHHVLAILGGRRENTTEWTRTAADNIWYRCTKQEGLDARRRFNKGYPDKIESDICYAYLGRPGDDGEEPEAEMIELKPGMRIYTAEGYYKKAPGRWEWQHCHMTMYAGDDKILDSVGLSRPSPRSLKPFYAGTPTMFVVLRVMDPFKDMRET